MNTPEEIFSQTEAQADTEALEQTRPQKGSLIRCKCGTVVEVGYPTRCSGCGEVKAYWKTLDGKVQRLSDMSLGHLTNTIRIVAAKADQLPPELRERCETALDLLYAELGSRNTEIQQATGMMNALTRQLNAQK